MRLMPNINFERENCFEVFTQFDHDEYVTGTPQLDGWIPTFAPGDMQTGEQISPAVSGVLTQPNSQITITGTPVADQFHSFLRTHEEFIFSPNRPIRMSALFPRAYADDNLDELNIFVGCMEDMDTATELQDDGAGPRADSDMFGFFKVAQATGDYAGEVWNCVSGFGANQQITELVYTNPLNLSGADQKVYDGDVYRNRTKLVAEWVPINYVPGVAGAAPTLFDAEARFWINGVLCAKHQMRGAYQLTSLACEPMNFGYVSRTGLNQMIINHMEYLRCQQIRYGE